MQYVCVQMSRINILSDKKNVKHQVETHLPNRFQNAQQNDFVLWLCFNLITKMGATLWRSGQQCRLSKYVTGSSTGWVSWHYCVKFPCSPCVCQLLQLGLNQLTPVNINSFFQFVKCGCVNVAVLCLVFNQWKGQQILFLPNFDNVQFTC